jgi:hypothetical protein
MEPAWIFYLFEERLAAAPPDLLQELGHVE